MQSGAEKWVEAEEIIKGRFIKLLSERFGEKTQSGKICLGGK